MIFAEIHGKLGSGGQRAHDRSEDLLTSTAFGLLRYLPFAGGIGALLRRVRVVGMAGGRFTCAPSPDWIPTRAGLARPIEFWPRLPGYGEPDLRLTLDHERHVVLIEVKLHSGKSQLAHDDDDPEAGPAVDEDRIDPDQLARYYKGQRKRLPPEVELSIIFLTAHGSPPAADLADSFEREPAMRLGWLSWLDVWTVAEEAKQASVGDGPAADLARLLRHKGFSEFGGFDTAVPSLPTVGRFWDERIEAPREKTRFFQALRRFEVPHLGGIGGYFFKKE